MSNLPDFNFNPCLKGLSALVLLILTFNHISGQEMYVRYNQLGYLPEEDKLLLILTDEPLTSGLYVESEKSERSFEVKPVRIDTEIMGATEPIPSDRCLFFANCRH